MGYDARVTLVYLVWSISFFSFFFLSLCLELLSFASPSVSPLFSPWLIKLPFLTHRVTLVLLIKCWRCSFPHPLYHPCQSAPHSTFFFSLSDRLNVDSSSSFTLACVESPPLLTLTSHPCFPLPLSLFFLTRILYFLSPTDQAGEHQPDRSCGWPTLRGAGPHMDHNPVLPGRSVALIPPWL